MRWVKVALLALGLVTAAGQGAARAAASSDWVSNEAGRVRLVAAVATTGKAAMLPLGLHFQLQPGWKIYWRTPGDAGYAPRLDWTGSGNLGPVALSWPAPKRFVLAGLQNHGYDGEVLLPLQAGVPQPHQPVALRLSVDYLACAKICVPLQASLSLDLAAGPPQPSDFAQLISRFDARVPGPADRQGVTVEALETWGTGDQGRLRLRVRADRPFEHPDLFVEPAEVAGFDAPQMTLSADRTRLSAETAIVPGTLARPLAAGPLTVTLVDGERAMEATLVPTAVAADTPPPAGASAGRSWPAMLGLALLGGLILNLMPCVLPVLSIKILGALGHGGARLGHIRAAFLASAAGIVASFLALAAAAIAVKAAGAAVGWGIQFQQPLFLATMIALLLAFALNLWGVYEIRLPAALMNAGGGVPHHTVLGHFLSGAFATLLATPCSAPFVGTAVGFALAGSAAQMVAIFIALGLGMAAPFLLVAAWPRLAQRLPRPGRWMVRVRQGLGVALALTALWLGSILAVQWGLPLPGRAAAEDGAGPGGTAIPWIDFDRTAIDRAVAEGRLVFVDVTADWCITCKVNKATVLEREPVAARLREGGTVAMRADWTRPSDAIAAYLASFGRYGIPFNAVYGPAAPEGIALPELPSRDDVLEAMGKARP